MATDIIEIGCVSSRGQIAIPIDIRRELGLTEGTRMLFMLEDDTVVMKKVTRKSFAELTEPLRKAKKLIREEDVTDLIHRLRAKRKSSSTRMC
jgi:AbrB family looped-hinge helix DNA binding protein